MAERDPMVQLKSLLGIWYTDAPTWPPAPGIARALELLREVENDHLARTAEYLRFVKTDAALMRDRREGMVQVVDYDGRVVGCMGVETWAEALATTERESRDV